MASLINTAITTSHEIPTDRPGKVTMQQETDEKKTKQAEKNGVQHSKKYRHTFAVHNSTRASCLSQDSAAPTSFTGFRNLGALVISQCSASQLPFGVVTNSLSRV
jgi:diacylglycerol O-acyltransferase-1